MQRPKGVLPEDKMEDVLYDYHLAKAMGENLPYTENYKRALFLEYVYQKHETTKEVFDSSLVWYTRHSDVLLGVYEKVSERLKEQQGIISDLVAIRDNKPKISQPGDSVDLWIWEHLYQLTGRELDNKIKFTFPSDSNFRARDTLVWEANYKFVATLPDSSEAPVMAMQVVYSNDSIISEIKRVLDSGKHALMLQNDTLGKIKEVRGFVYYSGGKDSLKRVLVNEMSLMRYHSNDSLFMKTDSIEEREPVIEDKLEPQVKEEVIEKPVETEQKFINRPRPATTTRTNTSGDIQPVTPRKAEGIELAPEAK